ncbi:homeobox-leucine zipper protein [Striga asiatica]|uniref:Homeobox-leucine zipper protein n=1 Tax=Striga asiatica TaxID=4170 RepID=A0A5A7PPS2_STRAF|nr:homeobox-leucine zipper protein [Striga asiatica]
MVVEKEDLAGGRCVKGGACSPNSTIWSSSGKRSGGEVYGDVDRACSRGTSDEDEDDTDDTSCPNRSGSNKELRLSKDQAAVLEQTFKDHNTLNPLRATQVSGLGVRGGGSRTYGAKTFQEGKFVAEHKGVDSQEGREEGSDQIKEGERVGEEVPVREREPESIGAIPKNDIHSWMTGGNTVVSPSARVGLQLELESVRNTGVNNSDMMNLDNLVVVPVQAVTSRILKDLQPKQDQVPSNRTPKITVRKTGKDKNLTSSRMSSSLVKSEGVKRKTEMMNIDIWNANWIIKSPLIKPFCCYGGDRHRLRKVSDLSRRDDGGWDEELIKQTFLPFEAEEILKLRAPTQGKKDQMVWHVCPKGQFSVKHVYNFLVNRIVAAQDVPETSDNEVVLKKTWRKTWALQLGNVGCPVFPWVIDLSVEEGL